MYPWYDELISYSTGTGLMEPKCEQYWPTQEEKKKEFGHMEIFRRGKVDTRKDFTHQRFEVRTNSEGMLGCGLIISYIYLCVAVNCRFMCN